MYREYKYYFIDDNLNIDVRVVDTFCILMTIHTVLGCFCGEDTASEKEVKRRIQSLKPYVSVQISLMV